MKRFRFIIAMAALAVMSGTAAAGVPKLINYQGRLTNSLGNPVNDSTYSVTFSIYAQLSGGSNLWSETQGVLTNDGSFSVQLGTSVTLPDNLFDDTIRYIGIQVNPEQNEMTPRQRMVSTPYSYRVRTVDGATGGTIYGDVSIQSDLSIDGGMEAQGLIIQGGLEGLIIQGGLEPSLKLLQVKGPPGQTGNLMELSNSDGAPLVSVDPDGGVVAKRMALGTVNPGPPNLVPLLLQGAPDRTANLMEMKNSDDEIVASFDDGGALFSRYGVFAHKVHCEDSFVVSGDATFGGSFLTSGISEIPGSDIVISLGTHHLAPVGIGTAPSADVALRVESGGTLHELGHNFRLSHGGPPPPPSDDFLQAVDESGNKVASINDSGNFVSVIGYGYQGRGIRLDEGPDTTQDFFQAWDNLGNKVASIDPSGNMTLDGDLDGLNSTWENLQAIDINCENLQAIDINCDNVTVGGDVGIGTAIAHSKLHVGGAIATAVTIVNSPTSSITLDAGNSVVLCNAVLGTITVNLPTAVGIAGRVYTIKLIFSNFGTVTIDPFGNESIEGAATYSFSSQYRYVTIVSDGANWWIIANN